MRRRWGMLTAKAVVGVASSDAENTYATLALRNNLQQPYPILSNLINNIDGSACQVRREHYANDIHLPSDPRKVLRADEQIKESQPNIQEKGARKKEKENNLVKMKAKHRRGLPRFQGTPRQCWRRRLPQRREKRSAGRRGVWMRKDERSSWVSGSSRHLILKP